MSEALLSVENLTLVSNQGIIVKDISFSIAPGEIVALTGKSGSGKTSIALALLHLLPPGIRLETGSIVWRSKDHKDLCLPLDSQAWSALRGSHIGYTQQDVFGAFDPVLSMGRQMMMVIQERTARMDSNLESQLRIKMEEVGLHDLDRLWVSYPHQLSGGQLQRCQIAMAIVIQPELLISDEPTSAIDKINQIELLDVFSMLRNKYNTAILCITHEEAVVRHLADREIQLGAITNEFPLPEPRSTVLETKVRTSILEAKDLMYTHTYGGMMYDKGATIGPLDFSISAGRCLGIVGESGSGKSTLAQLLVGLYSPSKGTISLEGKWIDFNRTSDIKQLRSKIQLVMQDGRGSLHPYMTVRDLLEEIIILQHSEVESELKELAQKLKEVGLPESVQERRPGQLSGGECLRVSLARALLMQPKILICDESTSALDGETRDGIVDLLRSLMVSRGLALVFISHDERIIRGVSDEIIVLHRGKVVEKGPAEEVIGYPTHQVTKKIFATHATLVKRPSL